MSSKIHKDGVLFDRNEVQPVGAGTFGLQSLVHPILVPQITNQAPTISDTATTAGVVSIALVSGNSSGQIGDGGSGLAASPVFSPDGTKVAFDSNSTNFGGGTDALAQLYIKDLATGALTLISTSSSGATANNGNWFGGFSPDGTKVAFDSFATNLVAGQTNPPEDIFVKNLSTGAVTLASVDATGHQLTGSSFFDSFSPDGTEIAFTYEGSDSLTASPHGFGDSIYVKNLVTGAITLVSSNASGQSANGQNSGGVFTADGNGVFFNGDDTALTGANFPQVYLKNLATGAVTLVSADASGTAGNFVSMFESATADSTKVLFESVANNLTPNAPGFQSELYLKDLTTGAITLVSTNAAGEAADLGANNGVITADGTKIVFDSTADNLVAGVGGNVDLIYVKDLETGTVSLLSQTGLGGVAEGNSSGVAISADGSRITFDSDADNLVPGDVNGNTDVFAANLGYIAKAAPVVLAGGITLGDADSANLAGATVTISQGFQSGDTLAAATAGTAITATYNAASHTLTLSGADTLAHYQQVLRSVTFANATNSDPAASPTRTISWQVDDGAGVNHASAVSTTTINVVDHATGTHAGLPVISGTLAEGQTATADLSGVTDPNGIGTVHYTWTRDDFDHFTVIGTDSPTLLLDNDTGGHQIQLNITYVDGLGDPETITSVESDAVVNVDSQPTGAVVIEGTLKAGQTVFADTSTVQDADGLGDFGYTWYRLNAAGHIVSSISNANGPTYTLTSADVGFGLLVDVSYTDQQGSNDDILSAKTAVVSAGNSAPVLANAGAAVGYTENGAAVVLEAGVTLADSDTALMFGATVTIASGAAVGDVLSFTAASGIGGVYNATTHTLTLSGSASAAAYQAVLQSVRFASTSDNPDNFGLNPSRTVVFQVDDGQTTNDLSNTITATVNVTAINDAPVLGGLGNMAGFIRAATPVAAAPALTITDSDTATLAGATVVISSGFQTGDLLSFTAQHGITGSFNAGTHTLTLSGTASVADYQAALESIAFSTTNNSINGLASRTLSWTVDDGQSVNHASATGTSTVGGVADTTGGPLLFNGASTAVYTEQAVLVVIAPQIAVSTVAEGHVNGATITISSGFVAGDVLSFSPQHGITGSYNAATHTLTLAGDATAANYSQVLESVTFSSSSDNPTNFDANPDRTISWTASFGSSGNTVTTTVAVAGVDDPASLHNDAFTVAANAILTDGTSVFANNGSGADSDPDNVLHITAVNGQAAGVGHAVTLSSGALLTLNADGSFTYDPNGAFEHLAAAGSGSSDTQGTDTFSYTVNGGANETATVTVNGIDDNDILHLSNGVTTYDGGAGYDTLVINEPENNFGNASYDPATGISTLVDFTGTLPTLHLKNIEAIQFSDHTVSIATAPGAGQISGPDVLSFITFDAANDHPWATIDTALDVSGSTGSIQTLDTVTDGGTEWLDNFDHFNNQTWLWNSASFDSAHNELTFYQADDDGSATLTLFDAANAYRWSQATVAFDAHGNITGVTGINDDNSHTVSMADIETAYDNATWYTTPYDPNLGAAQNDTISGGVHTAVLFGFAGDDTLDASFSAAGSYLDGGKGNDTLIGNPFSRADTFVFHDGDGNDVINLFDPVVDNIQLHGYGIDSFAELQSFITQIGPDTTVITFDPDNTITLHNVAMANLNAGDFVFS